MRNCLEPVGEEVDCRSLVTEKGLLKIEIKLTYEKVGGTEEDKQEKCSNNRSILKEVVREGRCFRKLDLNGYEAK